MRALIAIHDVMPETLPRVRRLVGELRERGHRTVTLLVVPGRDWSDSELEELAGWQREGLELAAHGWSHRVERFGGAYHRLHGALLSRRAAEHLALSPDSISERMRAAADWFRTRGLAAPSTYVPPAWAPGRLRTTDLQALPYHRIEVTRGLLEVATRRLHPLPLCGYEADTTLRRHFLHHWNRHQEARAVKRDRPLRIAIHPHDGELPLAGELRRLLEGEMTALRYDEYPPERIATPRGDPSGRPD